MTGFLIRHFIKNDVDNGKMRESYGRLSGSVGIACNVFLSAIKLAAGLIFGSVSVTADAANNLTDAMSSLVTLIGFKLSGKPADKKHPYGHERIEYVAGLIVSFLILFIGVELVKMSFGKVVSGEESGTGALVLIILGVSVCVKLWLFAFNRKIGKKIDSAVICATAQDSLNDAIATSAVLISAAVSHFSGFNLDGYAGMAVAVYIIVSGIGLIKDTADPLLGTAPTPEFTKKIEDKITAFDGVDGIHDLIIHNYGPNRCFASVHLEVSAKQDILISHDIADNIERDFKRDMGIDLVVHLDPIVKDDEDVNRAKAMVGEIIAELDPIITYHDFRMVKGASHSNLIFDICVPVDYALSDGELTKIISDKVSEKDKTFVCVITVDKNFCF